jgi:3-methyladenine DNA glycosylase/8-oxoguanine DNA glycosylase
MTLTRPMFPPWGTRNGSRVAPYARTVPVEADVRPRGPFSLRLSARRSVDGRTYRGGLFSALMAIEGRVERGIAAQRQDGSLRLRAESEAGLERLRFVLALDDDHSEFLRLFADDELIGQATRHLRGLRPLRTATVAHALLRAIAGQLITMQEARMIEGRVNRAAGTPPTAQALGRFAPAELQRLGLSARKAATLVRLCRSIDLEQLRGLDGDAVAARLLRERGIGPYSLGVVFLEGLGRYDRGINRDLGLVKLLSAIRGHWVEAEETDELLARYGEWQGIASVYLLAGWSRGLVPVKATPAQIRHSRIRTRYAA